MLARPKNARLLESSAAIWDLYKRLKALAMGKYKVSDDDAHDAAADAVTAAFLEDAVNFSFGAACVRNFLYMKWRKADHRREIGGHDLYADNPTNDRICSTAPTQEIHLTATECVNALGHLPEPVRPVMEMVALEYSPDEICKELGLKKRAVYDRAQEGRHILRARDSHDIGRKRGHHAYIGVKKDRRKWYAFINVNGDRRRLGSFATATEAARAYDQAAKQVHGSKAKLNFDYSEDEHARAI